MENAGKSCVTRLVARGVMSAVVCCGTGNNGGDGFVIARHLAVHGTPVKVLLCGEPGRIKGDARVNYKIAESIELEIVQVDDSWTDQQLNEALSTVQKHPTDWIIDCMLGTGATGDPRPPIDRVIKIANQAPAKRMAVDVPSGLDCETGEPAVPTFNADFTCTFVTRKTGFQNPVGRDFLGDIRVVSIGIPMSLVERVLNSNE